MAATKQPDNAWIEFASKEKPKPKPPPTEEGPLMKSYRRAMEVNARYRAGELTRDEANRLVAAIVEGVE